jgi:hypothetical protein
VIETPPPAGGEITTSAAYAGQALADIAAVMTATTWDADMLFFFISDALHEQK